MILLVLVMTVLPPADLLFLHKEMVLHLILPPESVAGPPRVMDLMVLVLMEALVLLRVMVKVLEGGLCGRGVCDHDGGGRGGGGGGHGGGGLVVLVHLRLVALMNQD